MKMVKMFPVDRSRMRAYARARTCVGSGIIFTIFTAAVKLLRREELSGEDPSFPSSPMFTIFTCGVAVAAARPEMAPVTGQEGLGNRPGRVSPGRDGCRVAHMAAALSDRAADRSECVDPRIRDTPNSYRTEVRR